MSNEPDRRDASRPASSFDEIDSLCDRFESAWQGGERPRIEDFLTREPGVQSLPFRELLTELVKIDIEYRWRLPRSVSAVGTVPPRQVVASEEAASASGLLPVRPRLEHYVARYQGLGPVGQLPVELIAKEYFVRRRWGDRPSHDEYAARFGGARAGLGEALSAVDRELASGDTIEHGSQQVGTDAKGRPATLEIRCPHCRNPVEIASQRPVAEVTCPSCGNGFRVPEKATEATLAYEAGTRDDQGARAASGTDGYSVPPYRRFRIIRPHAAGGLGKVSVATDEELHREVAFKELLDRHAGDPDCRSRFVLEAEITGLLEHPGVVPVYGLGRHADGRPFYAMRFIRGDSLKEAVDRFHKTDVGGRDPGEQVLDMRKLLGRFVDVCNTIHFAHSRGVLHRDLKPNNIMLGNYGETLVVDWGLAKLMGRPEEQERAGAAEKMLHPASGSGSAATQMGSVVGTPAFMSPEQAEGRLDQLGPATDVYSLGAILYCILVGHPPFRGTDISLLLSRVREGEFVRPRQMKRRVPAPLEAVCVKAMALAPQDRYATAAALAEDIERWLADEPVSAHRETLRERVGRLTRRHRGWAQAGAAALLVVAVVSVIAAIVVDREKNKAVALAASNERLAQEEREARQDAVSRFRVAIGAVDTWLTGAADALKYFPGLLEARKRLLEKAAEDYQRLAEHRSEDVALEMERGRAYLRLGDIRRILGESTEAEDAYRSAESHFTELAQKHPDVHDCRLELANSRTRLGLLLAETGRHAEADEAYGSAIAELTSAAESTRTALEFRDALGTALLNRGTLLIQTGRRQEAEQIVRQAVGQFDAVTETGADEPRFHQGASKARNVLGQLLFTDGRNEEAWSQIAQSVASLDALVDAVPDNPEYLESRASSRIFLAGVLRRLGRYSEELAAYRASVADYQTLLKATPGVPLYRENLALTQVDLGQLLYELGRTAEGEAELSRAMPVIASLLAVYPQFPRYHEEQAACLDVRGRVLSDRGHNEQAKSDHELAAETYRQLAEAFPTVPQYRERRAVCRSHLGQVLHKLGEHAAARQHFLAAVKTLEDLIQTAPEVTAYRDELAFVHEHLGVLLQDMDETAEAQSALERARALRHDLVEQSPAPEYLHNLAWFLANCPSAQFRNPEEAIALVRQAREEAPQNATFCNTLGVAYYRSGDWQKSIETLREAIRLRPEGNGRDWLFLAMAQWRLGDSEQAKESFSRGRRWMEENRPDNLELKRIHEEAAGVLGSPKLDTPPGPPADRP